MNKSQLVSYIATKSDLAVTTSEKLLAAVLSSIEFALAKGDSVSLVGFGNFGVKERAARKVRNPQTKQEMQIKAATVPYFKAGKGLKEQVDNNK